MSMSSKVEKSIWELLDFGCGLEAGRTAYMPHNGLLVSSFKVENEKKRKAHQIKTIISGATIIPPPANEVEEEVLDILQKRNANGKYEYQVLFASGAIEWLSPERFIDDNGTICECWLLHASEAELESSLHSFTQRQLSVRN